MEYTGFTLNSAPARRLLLLALFALAFGFVESSVVVYLRAIYYPEGFRFPLRVLSPGILAVELAREAATMVVLAAVAVVAGRSLWERAGHFLFVFGVWDLAYYLWLKIVLNWPGSPWEWDILFLIPVVWIGPVIAPVLIALLMTVCGAVMVLRLHDGRPFRPGWISWAALAGGTALVLFSFTSDTAATLRGAFPEPYRYDLLAGGILVYVAGFVTACRTSRTGPVEKR